eukprot:TRINITY_DN10560_c0_g1_i1.p1 TRINITY_DN10560_c0_g1~~TRINITY_DN10560_c0_g1_i1.p1  ORF type:complete len:171 (-),score=18.95 TRINITY_DN10560_c0_g1_i1:63-575(-)
MWIWVVALVLIPLVVIALRRLSGRRPINDIVTDSSEDGLKKLAFRWTTPRQPYLRYYPELQKKMYPAFGPLEVKGSVPDVWNTVKFVVSSESKNIWNVTSVDDTEKSLEFVATTKLLRFKDDVRVVVSPSSTAGYARIDARSKSRVGRGDLGANYKRLTYLFERIRSASQ